MLAAAAIHTRTAPPAGVLISIPFEPKMLVSEKFLRLAECANATEGTLRPISQDVNDALTDATLSVVVELLASSNRPGDGPLMEAIEMFLAERGRF